MQGRVNLQKAVEDSRGNFVRYRSKYGATLFCAFSQSHANTISIADHVYALLYI